MLPEWRWARDVLKGINKGREYRCPFCKFPIRPTDTVLKGDRRWAHAFCMNEVIEGESA